MKKVLIYTQDPGGAQNIALVARRLVKEDKVNIATVVHPLAKDIFKESTFPFKLLTDMGFSPPLSENQAADFLVAGSFTHVFCGTSNPRYDPTNSNIIKAARRLGLPCFGLMEHWKGWDRFYNEAGKLSSVPDLLGCIDEFSAQRLEQLGIPKQRLAVIGHPYLEWIYQQKRNGTFDNENKSKKKIILISQPLVNRSFESVFSLQIDFISLIEHISKILEELKKAFDFTVFYRPHPKEKALVDLPNGIILDQRPRWIEALKSADIAVGLDSMALIEAFFAGKRCISLKLPELKDTSDMSCPFQFSVGVPSLKELKTTLSQTLSEDNSAFPDADKCKDLIAGSIDKCIRIFYEFLKLNQAVRAI